MEDWHLKKEIITFHKFLKRKIYEKKAFLHYITTTINAFNLVYYNQKQETFLHEKMYFLLNKNVFIKKGKKEQKVR
jgi:hypothetical protein